MFDRCYFQTLLDDSKAELSAKAFLATTQRIPGLGNGVLQDILFNACIHPKRKMSTLSVTELDDVYTSVKNTLKVMTSLVEEIREVYFWCISWWVMRHIKHQ